MFGYRRRRPLLGAAVIAGTASVAARRGARQQADMEAERQFQAQQAAEMKRLEEERDQARNQRAIDQAVAEAMAKQQQEEQRGRAADQSPLPPRPGSYGNQHFADEHLVDPGSGVYGSPPVGQAMHLQPPMAAGGISPRRRPSPGPADPDVCFCSSCGARSNVQFRFCAQCGQPMANGSPEMHGGPGGQLL